MLTCVKASWCDFEVVHYDGAYHFHILSRLSVISFNTRMQKHQRSSECAQKKTDNCQWNFSYVTEITLKGHIRYRVCMWLCVSLLFVFISSCFCFMMFGFHEWPYSIIITEIIPHISKGLSDICCSLQSSKDVPVSSSLVLLERLWFRTGPFELPDWSGMWPWVTTLFCVMVPSFTLLIKTSRSDSLLFNTQRKSPLVDWLNETVMSCHAW